METSFQDLDHMHCLSLGQKWANTVDWRSTCSCFLGGIGAWWGLGTKACIDTPDSSIMIPTLCLHYHSPHPLVSLTSLPYLAGTYLLVTLPPGGDQPILGWVGHWTKSEGQELLLLCSLTSPDQMALKGAGGSWKHRAPPSGLWGRPTLFFYFQCEQR